MNVPLIQPPLCGNCAFAETVKEDLNLVQCEGAPPTPVILGMGPQGPVVNILYPRVIRAHKPCALWKRKEAAAVSL